MAPALYEQLASHWRNHKKPLIGPLINCGPGSEIEHKQHLEIVWVQSIQWLTCDESKGVAKNCIEKSKQRHLFWISLLQTD